MRTIGEILERTVAGKRVRSIITSQNSHSSKHCKALFGICQIFHLTCYPILGLLIVLGLYLSIYTV